MLYNEGFLVLTGSWDLRSGSGAGLDGGYFPGSATTSDYVDDTSDLKLSKWIYFGQSISGAAADIPEVSFFMEFSGTNYTPVLTMNAHARRGELNYSNNPTFLQYGQSTKPQTSSFIYKEPTSLVAKNTISSSFCDFDEPYKKQTFISKIGIYDKDRNLIAIAKLATPVRKLENDDYTFKLKLDI